MNVKERGSRTQFTLSVINILYLIFTPIMKQNKYTLWGRYRILLSRSWYEEFTVLLKRVIASRMTFVHVAILLKRQCFEFVMFHVSATEALALFWCSCKCSYPKSSMLFRTSFRSLKLCGKQLSQLSFPSLICALSNECIRWRPTYESYVTGIETSNRRSVEGKFKMNQGRLLIEMIILKNVIVDNNMIGCNV
jgi:hypothetical protein